MKKYKINNYFIEHIKAKLSPTEEERMLASKIYDDIKKVLGNKCILTGSFARFTATTPMKDIDILYILDLKDIYSYNENILVAVKEEIMDAIKEKQLPQADVNIQTHSITLEFKEIPFSVDIVPAIPNGFNNFGKKIFLVPEILMTGYTYRLKKYTELQQNNKHMRWILSDPLGYIEETKIMNGINNNFRKVVKFVKKWKNNCKNNILKDAPKSFHIERIVYNIFKRNNNISCIEAIFKFFVELKLYINNPQIIDRADSNKYIDDYLMKWTDEQKQLVKDMCDNALLTLECIGKNSDNIKMNLLLQNLLNPTKKEKIRDSNTEQFMFDYNIPVFIDDTIKTKISGKAYLKDKMYVTNLLTKSQPSIEIGKKIYFSVSVEGNGQITVTEYWKVKNDIHTANHNQIRGEITKYQTKNYPEETSFKGNHYVECYIVMNGECVSYDRLPVNIV